MIELAINTMMADNTIGSHSPASDTISSLLFCVLPSRNVEKPPLEREATPHRPPRSSPRILWGPSTAYLEPQMAGRVAPPALSCHPDRRDPAFLSRRFSACRVSQWRDRGTMQR